MSSVKGEFHTEEDSQIAENRSIPLFHAFNNFHVSNMLTNYQINVLFKCKFSSVVFLCWISSILSANESLLHRSENSNGSWHLHSGNAVNLSFYINTNVHLKSLVL